MSRKSPTRSDEPHQEVAYIVHPEVQRRHLPARSLESVLEEITGLAGAINLDVAAVKNLNVPRIQAGAFLGKGQIQNIGDELQDIEPDVVIFDYALSPVQQRNLEKVWDCKVIDRTGLILEIFGARAQTKEGRLQVELAALEYQKSRLVRSWTHLERQRGGAGFMGGPGETQIEIDRRLISEKITKLKKELQNVRRTRDLGRRARERVPFPVVALVGYTNAGKSTLFNTLTNSSVFAEDLLFATLDPTMRRLELPSGQECILSDTVGFISDLPTHLIEAFRATLEQINQADVIVHVMDMSCPDQKARRQDVIGILEDLGIQYETDERIIEAWNKIDLLDRGDGDDLKRQRNFEDRAVPISALSGQGIDDLLRKIADILSRERRITEYSIPSTDGKALSWLYDHGEVVMREDGADNIIIHVMMPPESVDKFKSHYGYSPDYSSEKK